MKKVIIIGAGPAGLTAAFELCKGKDYEILILEESQEIGGISKTVNYRGNRMDMGGHRFFSKSELVNTFWNEILPMESVDCNPETADLVMLRRKRVSRILYEGKFFDYPVTLNKSTLKNMGFFSTIGVGFSYIASVIHKRPETNLENFYINRFGKKLYRMFFESYTENLWGRHPRDIDASWGAQRVKGLSIRALLKDIIGKKLKQKNRKIETSLIEEFKYPKFGPGQMWENVAQRVRENGGTLILGASVVKVDPVKKEVIYIKDGEKVSVSGDYIISSMPVKDLILAMDDVPEDVHAIGKGLPYRDYMTLGVLVKNFRLVNKKNGNIVPDCWIYVQDTSVKMGRLQIYNNWSPYLVKNPSENVWLGLEYFVDEGDSFWEMNEEEFARFAISEMVKINLISNDSDVLDYHMEKIKKAYPAYFDTYENFDKVKAFLNRFDNLYCVGRNGQHRYNNMDHSMITAMEAVKLIRGEESDRNIMWNVNTEKIYHEKQA